MNWKKRILAAAAVLTAIMFTGCGLVEKQENIDAGMAAVEAVDYTKALEHFEKALVSGENQQLVFRGQGLAYMGLTQYEEAKTALIKAISLNRQAPDDLAYDMNYYLATAYYKLGDLQSAIDTYSAILALKPKELEAYYLRGSVLMDKGNYEEGIADFNQAIALSGDDYGLYIDIYLSCDKNGYTEQGQTYLKTLLAENDAALSLFDKGRISYYLQDYETARNSLEKARSGDAKTPETILLLGKTYEALGDYNYASSVYTDYLQGDTASVDVYNQLGLCRMTMKDYQSALDAFQAAMKVENNGMMQTLQYNEIIAYEYLGEYQQAAVSMDKYLKNYPDDTNAQREYQFLKTR